MGDGFLGVVIGGLIGIIASVAGPALQHFLSDRTRREEARHGNIQAIILAVYELDDWLEKSRGNIAFGEKNDIGPSPLGKVEALTLVHFPELGLQLTTFAYSVARYNKWGVERMEERINGKPLTMGDWKDIAQGYGLAKSNLIAAVCGKPELQFEKAYGLSSSVVGEGEGANKTTETA